MIQRQLTAAEINKKARKINITSSTRQCQSVQNNNRKIIRYRKLFLIADISLGRLMAWSSKTPA